VGLKIVADLRARPSWRFVSRHPAHVVAFGFGAGLAPVAPGTAGTLLAFPIYWWVSAWLGAAQLLALLALLFGAGIWACGRTGRALGVPDHPAMVWDETVAFMAVLFFTPPGLLWQAGAFLLFRFFDILKPPPIRQLDRRLKSGFGVMLDDVLAAFYAVLVLAAVKALID
jgi:phosphatidylglycerophosphatase A